MAIEVYKGKLFRHGHERRALGLFLQQLYKSFGETNDLLYMVVVEVDVNSAEIDLLLLSSKAIIIVDLKELTAATALDAEKIHIKGKTSGPWEYSIPGKVESVPLGGSINSEKNPYKQIERLRFRLGEWLGPKLTLLFGNSWRKEDALDILDGWAVLSPGYDGSTEEIELPWGDIHKKHDWFRVIPLKDLAWEFHCTTDLRFELTERQMRFLVEELGAIRVNNLGEVVPSYFPTDLPPVPHSFLFTRLPQFSYLIGREQDISEIVEWVNEPSVSVISIKGMGGIGKTSLLGYVVKGAEVAGWTTRYVACRDKQLTVETFLAALASEIQDKVLAHYILDKQNNNILDRLDAGLDHLERQKTLLVIDDFQKVSASDDVAKIIRRLPPRSSKLKVILSSREHPQIVDHPELLGLVKEKSLYGLPKDNIVILFGDQQEKMIDRERLEWVWERTAGNPYAIGLLKPLISKYGWSDVVTGLPLYQSDQDRWFESLVETLDNDALNLARKLSVTRTEISRELIDYVSHDPQKATFFTYELVDKFIIQESELKDRFSMHDFIREYLYDHFTDPKQKTKAHIDAAKYYERLADNMQFECQAGETLYEALYHYDKAGQDDEILRLAERAFLPLYNHGDWDRAHTISTIALKAARAKSKPIDVARWLLHISSWEFEHDQIKQAGLHLQQALDQLPKIGPKTPGQEKQTILEIKANIAMEKGRIAYYVSDFDLAQNHLLEALTIIKEIENRKLLSECLMRIARIERQKGDYANSRIHLEEARKIASATNDYPRLIQSISHLGLIARQENDYEQAQKLFEEAYENAKVIGDWRGMETNQSLKADLAQRQGDFATAAEMFKDCLDQSRRVGNGLAIRISLGQLAESLIRLGRLDEAKPYLDEVDIRTKNIGDGIGLACTLHRKGLYLKKQGNTMEGERLILQGIEKLREIGSEVYIRDFEKDLGSIQ
jgi:tetratricopeptide (TPR) repeat protein